MNSRRKEYEAEMRRIKKDIKEDIKSEFKAFKLRQKNSKNLIEVDTAKGIKLRGNMRSNLWASIKHKKNIGNTEYYLGCSISELILYIESKFEPGMSWENHGYNGWHLDHIKPFFIFDMTNEDHKKEVGHYTNLRPIWYKDHRAKTKIEKKQMKEKIIRPIFLKEEDHD